MKVFISSLISGYEQYRAAVAEAIETLGHEVVRAEDFGATPSTPQQTCLAAVRASDAVVLLLGDRYGYVQEPSGLSATHEEYREARDRKPVLVFVEDLTDREERQAEFIREVEGWSTGHYRMAYSTPDQLRRVVLRALHDQELATSIGSVDESEILGRALAAIPDEHGSGWSGQSLLCIAVSGGPHQQIVRPVEIEDPTLAADIQQEAFFGGAPVLDRFARTACELRGNALVLKQDRASVGVDQAGSILICQPATRADDIRRTGLSALIEEDVVDDLERAIRFSGWLLDRIDPLRRLSDVVPVAQISGAEHIAWRSRADYVANPNTSTMSMRGGEDSAVSLTPPSRRRASLIHDARRLAEDLAVLLRRERQR